MDSVDLARQVSISIWPLRVGDHVGQLVFRVRAQIDGAFQGLFEQWRFSFRRSRASEPAGQR